MAKKFFYDRVHNTKRTIINFVIIGFCVIGIIICFAVTSNFQGENQNEPQGELSLNSETIIEVNESYNKDIFFSKIENVSLDDIDVTYPDNFDISKPGTYEITVTVNKESRTSKLTIVDTIMPELTLKEVSIKENESYNYNDFITSCSDNSKHDCVVSFYKEGTDQEGKIVNYANYKKAGTYSIKISAKDESGNETIKETKLIITTNKVTEPKPKPEPDEVTCKYGNNEYDINNYVLAVDKTSNSCALSLDLYKEDSMTNEINKMMDTESVRIKKDVNALKLKGTLAMNRKINVVLNKDGSGIVGYQLRITITLKNGDDVSTVVDYKVDSNGKRVFISNDHNLKS